MKIKFVLVLLFSITIMLLACKKEIKGNENRFKQGLFEIPAGEGYSKTTIKRIDSLQIERYTKKVSITNDKGELTEKEVERIDTLYIKWRNNFSYTLKFKNPKTDLDKDITFVQINKLTENSYSFKARIGYSKFTTEGKVIKIK